MSDPLKRREFIKNLSLAGASIAITNYTSAAGDENSEIRNQYFTISFNKKNGTINIYRSNGTALLTGGTTCVNAGSKRYLSPDNYKYSFYSKSFDDQNGPGKRLSIVCKDKSKKLDAEIQLSLYDKLEAVTTELTFQNISFRDITINSAEPIRVIKNE